MSGIYQLMCSSYLNQILQKEAFYLLEYQLLNYTRDLTRRIFKSMALVF